MLERDEYARFRVSPVDPAALRCADVERILNKLAESSAGRLHIEQFAKSVEARPIYLATIGAGPRRVLLWTQMHGDEPTHTAVVIDLLSYLLRSHAEPHAKEILAGTTLHIMPMLNPDGAEAITRFNAQGIDVNRDARRLATPEGRALRRAVETLRPDFGFNLHNQNARTSVGNPPRSAVVSVLAPPPDERRTESHAMRRAKHMCATFVEAVRPYAARMMSRYDDTYEPRAFGDTIQSLGTATMLIEAGGWHEVDPEPLTRLHFHGLVTTLHAIATDSYLKANVDSYELLPRSNSRALHDSIVAGGHLLDATVSKPFRADLAIDQSHGHRIAVMPKRDGKVVDIGDLSTTGAKVLLAADDSLILPGRIAILDDWSPARPLSDERANALLASGTTTAVVMVDLADRDAVEAVASVKELPFNWAYIGRLTTSRALDGGELAEHAALGASTGMLAVVSEQADETLWQQLDRFGVPLLQPSQLPSQGANASYQSFQDLAQQNWTLHNLLKLQARRGRLARDACADLTIFDSRANLNASQPVDWQRLKRVLVAGETVWQDGRPTGATPGTLLRRG